MAIDSVRLLTDSAAQIWRRLADYSPIEALSHSSSFEEWLDSSVRTRLGPAEEQSLRRDYRRLINLIEEIDTLVRSRDRALELVQTRIAEVPIPRSPAA
ncbi:MAG: hypothetical protein HC822_16065 [Oscillochloris sp.]|nr:hypothetical protein [Oscillochloris sp.]